MLTYDYDIKGRSISCRDEDGVLVKVFMNEGGEGFTGYVKYQDRVEAFEYPYIDYSETINARIRVCVKRLFRAAGIKKQA